MRPTLFNYAEAWTSKDLRTIQRLARQGHSLKEIGRQVGRSHASLIRAYCQRIGRSYRTIRADAIEAEIRRGRTARSIADRFGTSCCSIRYHARRLGLALRKPDYRKRAISAAKIHGYPSLGAMGWDQDRVRASQQGWPPGVLTCWIPLMTVLYDAPEGLLKKELARLLHRKASGLNNITQSAARAGVIQKTGASRSTRWVLADDCRRYRDAFLQRRSLK